MWLATRRQPQAAATFSVSFLDSWPVVANTIAAAKFVADTVAFQ